VAGVALGLIVSLGVTRLLAKMLFGVSATDPKTFFGDHSVVDDRGAAGLLCSRMEGDAGRSLVALRDE